MRRFIGATIALDPAFCPGGHRGDRRQATSGADASTEPHGAPDRNADGKKLRRDALARLRQARDGVPVREICGRREAARPDRARPRLAAERARRRHPVQLRPLVHPAERDVDRNQPARDEEHGGRRERLPGRLQPVRRHVEQGQGQLRLDQSEPVEPRRRPDAERSCFRLRPGRHRLQPGDRVRG